MKGDTVDQLHQLGTPEFDAVLRASLAQQQTEYPFYLLNPAFPCPGFRWWQNRLSELLKRVNPLAAAQRLLCVEFFPNHSRQIGRRTQRVPSQDFGVHLVRSAMSRDAIVVVLRSRHRWVSVVPEFQDYHRLFVDKNPQQISISPVNCPDGFEAIVQTIKSR